MQLGFDLVVFENPVIELYWKGLPEASNVEGKLSLLMARGVMSVSPIRALWRLI